MDGPTEKMPTVFATKAKGVDTLARYNAILAFTESMITVFIPTIGEVQIVSFQTTPNAKYVHLNVVDAYGKEFFYTVPWSTQFHVYLGDV